MLLTDYLRRVAQRWRIILVVVLATTAVAAAVSFSLEPKYESRSRVFISNSANIEDLGTQMAAGVYAQQKVLSYAAVASSATMSQRVIDTLDLDMSPAELTDEVSATVEFGTVLVTIVVTDPDPDTAVAINNAIIDNYNTLLNQIDSGEGGESPVTVSVMEAPSLPSSPASPNIGLNLVAALFAGLLLGVAIAVIRDLLDDTVKDTAELEDIGVATLGSIPKRATTGLLRREDPSVVVGAQERTQTAEAVRQLRTNLRFAAIDRAPKSILITSSEPGEGKSFLCSNLASAYAATGERVVLVDLDLRRPVHAERLGLERNVGVTSVLLGQIELGKALQPVEGAHFELLASGPLPPNPADVLSTRALHELLVELASAFDIVIIDSPPAAMFADARQVAGLVDATIVVSRHKRTKQAALATTVKSLQDVGGAVLGVVVNLVPSSGGSYDPYEYYGPDAGAAQSHRAG